MFINKKYVPSIKNNNVIKEEILKDIKAFLYKVEKGKYGNNLNKDAVNEFYLALKESCENIENVLFTGQEDLSTVKNKINQALEETKKTLEGDFNNRFIENSNNLLYYLDSFVSIANGDISYIDEEESSNRTNWSNKKLYARLDELKQIKSTFEAQDRRLENEIKSLEKDKIELDDKMFAENNERTMNELFRKISATNSKLDMLNVRRSNYSACFNVLDIVYANAKEILTAGQFSVEETTKAKALLNINKLKLVASEPDKAITILKQMEKEIKNISSKVARMDEKVFGLNSEQTSVTDSALAYKEELMKKRREKEANSENLMDLTKDMQSAFEIKEEK